MKNQNRLPPGTRFLAVSLAILAVLSFAFAFIARSNEKDNMMVEFRENYNSHILAAYESKDITVTKQELVTALSYIGDMKIAYGTSDDDATDIVMWYKNGMSGLGYLVVFPEKRDNIMEMFVSKSGNVFMPCVNTWDKIEHASSSDDDQTIRNLADATLSNDDSNDQALCA